MQLPFEKIKIDQSFVRGMSQHADALAIISAVVGLADSLGMHTTAEGVETDEQLGQSRRTGCTEVQGHLVGKPVACNAARLMAWAQVGISDMVAAAT